MEVGFGTQYNNQNRAFLQAMLARSSMTFRESRPVIAAILNAENEGNQVRPEQVTEEILEKFMGTAREAASLFDYEIRRTQHQTTRERVYAFVNTASDPQTQLATTFRHDELAFVKRALEAMFDKYNTPRMEVMALTDMQAVKLARPNRRESTIHRSDDEPTQSQANIDKGLKHSEVEIVLENLIGGGWFEKSREGFYSLTPRALLELRPWLVGTFNDPDAEAGEWQRIKFCEACKDIVTVGGRCAEPDCNFRIHDICEDAFWRMKRSKTCTRCSREWTGDLYVGERAVTSTQAYQRGRRQSGGRRGDLADEVVRQAGAGYETDDQEQ
ncbi:Nse1 non-SMC component of SMC5-6 complex [Cordyceps fumosorosea ARSEF 2679]|uniref:Non-structural maintenance of chromosomes element 1 homolog n=1 Tax=Cordyceps fumosorosea (strain ARSEF 2679) TaxID=1081104 RepID=A0A168AMW1_CORFA|nr:Nse1 non-SMC component of SMC5-6 complex [Cordyceps fumosorosea ARSEF 2679]OAA68958.1 Nse1 non-SMC component of SMC5-6 complex [Cordyceps fumosorosea ARSEF 2679]